MADEHVEELSFAGGEAILVEGARASAVYFVIEGSVRVITRDEHDHEVELAVLQRGEMFGEMSLLGDAPSSATVVADGAVVVQKMTRDAFMEAISSPLARMVMESLFARLRRMNSRFLEAECRMLQGGATHQTHHQKVVRCVTLTPVTADMRAVMRDKAVEVEKFPFHIGRGTDDEEGGIAAFFSLWSNNLSIDDHAPYNVSRKHCLIDKRRDGYYLVDQHSHYGTLVDGNLVGGDADQSELLLEPGSHRLQLGTTASPYLMQLDVPQE